MVLGTFFVARMMTDGQYRALETRGREMGQLLGKAGTDALLHRDIIALDGLIAETVKSQDMLYAYMLDRIECDPEQLLRQLQPDPSRGEGVSSRRKLSMTRPRSRRKQRRN